MGKVLFELGLLGFVLTAKVTHLLVATKQRTEEAKPTRGNEERKNKRRKEVEDQEGAEFM